MTTVEDRAVQAHIAIDDLFTAVGLARPEIEEVDRDSLYNPVADYGFLVGTFHLEHLPSPEQRAAERTELVDLIAHMPLAQATGPLAQSYQDRIEVLRNVDAAARERWVVYRVERQLPESYYSMLASPESLHLAVIRLMQALVKDRVHACVEQLHRDSTEATAP